MRQAFVVWRPDAHARPEQTTILDSGPPSPKPETQRPLECDSWASSSFRRLARGVERRSVQHAVPGKQYFCATRLSAGVAGTMIEARFVVIGCLVSARRWIARQCPTGLSSISSWHPGVTGCPRAFAGEWGQDRRRVFIALALGAATERPRWIPPGRYLIGRIGNTPYHYPHLKGDR